MRLLPHFSFSYALLLLAFTNSFEQEIGADDDDSEPVSSTFALKLDSTRQSLIYLAAESVGYFMLLLIVERCGFVPVRRICSSTLVRFQSLKEFIAEVLPLKAKCHWKKVQW